MSAPSSTRRPFADDARLELVRGAVRDGIGALFNLERVTGSIRVAPRALEGVIPDARTTVRELESCFAELTSVLAKRSPDASGALELAALAARELGALGTALDAAAGSLNAARRLALERVAHGSLPRLDAARTLLDALEDAEFARVTSADPFVLLRDSFHEDLAPEPAVPTWLVGAAPGERALRARGFTSLCRLAVAQALGDSADAACFSVEGPSVRVERARGDATGERLLVPRLAASSALAPCLRAMAASMRLDLVVTADRVVIT